MPDLEEIRSTLRAQGQEHLLRFYDALTEPQQSTLLAQLAAVPWGKLPEWIERFVRKPLPPEVPEKITPPPIVPARPRDDDEARRQDGARRRGRDLVAAGKVAAFVVAGGQGTRLGYEGPKGCLEATPVAHKPLFQVFAEQIRAAARRAGTTIPWYVMTSSTNDVATRAFFREHQFFGLDEADVFLLTQGTLPAISLDGKLLLAGPGQLAVSPDGHGGSLDALRASGALEDMRRRGIELISYFQVDNPLTHCIDPLFLGLHDEAGAQMSAKAVAKRDPLEKLGNFCMVDGRVRIIEYSDLPEELARATTDDGHLLFRAGSIAIHVLSLDFVEALTAEGAELPLHRALKKVPHLDEAGRTVQPDEPNAVKLERFVFDALPRAERSVILETERDEEFSPVKNADGPDSLATSLHDQVRRAAMWLEEAGVAVPRDANGQIAAAI